MSHYYAIPLVDEPDLAQTRAALGADFARILGYFREDGARSIVQIEEALAAEEATAMVRPAHMLKGEARQFGCRRLAEIAEAIEMTARRCVEQHSAPAVAAEAAMLRGCFTDSLALLDNRAAPAPLFPSGPAAPRPPVARPAAPVPAPGTRPRLFGRRTLR